MVDLTQITGIVQPWSLIIRYSQPCELSVDGWKKKKQICYVLIFITPIYQWRRSARWHSPLAVELTRSWNEQHPSSNMWVVRGGANNRPMRSLIADLAGDRLGVARHAQAGSELLLVCLLCHWKRSCPCPQRLGSVWFWWSYFVQYFPTGQRSHGLKFAVSRQWFAMAFRGKLSREEDWGGPRVDKANKTRASRSWWDQGCTIPVIWVRSTIYQFLILQFIWLYVWSIQQAT